MTIITVPIAVHRFWYSDPCILRHTTDIPLYRRAIRALWYPTQNIDIEDVFVYNSDKEICHP